MNYNKQPIRFLLLIMFVSCTQNWDKPEPWEFKFCDLKPEVQDQREKEYKASINPQILESPNVGKEYTLSYPIFKYSKLDNGYKRSKKGLKPQYVYSPFSSTSSGITIKEVKPEDFEVIFPGEKLRLVQIQAHVFFDSFNFKLVYFIMQHNEKLIAVNSSDASYMFTNNYKKHGSNLDKSYDFLIQNITNEEIQTAIFPISIHGSVPVENWKPLINFSRSDILNWLTTMRSKYKLSDKEFSFVETNEKNRPVIKAAPKTFIKFEVYGELIQPSRGGSDFNDFKEALDRKSDPEFSWTERLDSQVKLKNPKRNCPI